MQMVFAEFDPPPLHNLPTDRQGVTILFLDQVFIYHRKTKHFILNQKRVRKFSFFPLVYAICNLKFL